MTVPHIFYFLSRAFTLDHYLFDDTIYIYLQGYDIEQSCDTIQEKKVTACNCVVNSVSARHC